MTLHSTCTACGARQPIQAGFEGEDGKRLAMLLADMAPPLARAAIGYLGLFKPPKSELRTTTAIKRLQEVQELITAGVVIRDGRTGERRPAPPALWVEAMQTMVDDRRTLSLPLESHGYLRAVVFGIADRADAKAEAAQEAARREGRHRSTDNTENPVQTAIAHAKHMAELGGWTKEQCETYVADARAKHGG